MFHSFFHSKPIVIASYIVLSISMVWITSGQSDASTMNNNIVISQDIIKKLENKKIYFGHHSVGYNIVGGINELISKMDTNLKLVDSLSFHDYQGAAFAHSRIGYNTDPTSKIDQFSNHVSLLKKWSPDIVSFKFCYVDITHKSNAEKLFESYKANYVRIKQQNPDVTFVHFTVPLTVVGGGIKSKIKQIIGKKDGRKLSNIVRHEFNELLRKEYNGVDPIFDLAKIESTRTDGSREFFEENGKKYYSLVPAYSSDGAHLNMYGSKIVAKHLLEFYASL